MQRKKAFVVAAVAVVAVISGCSPGSSSDADAGGTTTSIAQTTSTVVSETTTTVPATTMTVDLSGPLRDPGLPASYRAELRHVVEMSIPGDLTSSSGFELDGRFVAPIAFDYQFEDVKSAIDRTTHFVSKGFDTFTLEPNQKWRRGATFAPIAGFSNDYGAVNNAIDIEDLYEVLADIDQWSEDSIGGQDVRSYTVTGEALDELINWRIFVPDLVVREVADASGVFHFNSATHHLIGYDIDAELVQIDDATYLGIPEDAELTAHETLRISRIDVDTSPIELPEVVEVDAPDGFVWLELDGRGIRMLYPDYMISTGTGNAPISGVVELAAVEGFDTALALLELEPWLVESYTRLEDLAREFAAGVELTAGPTSVTSFEVGDGYVGFLLETEVEGADVDQYMFTDGSRVFVLQTLVVYGEFEVWELTEDEVAQVLSSIELYEPIEGSST